MKKILLAGLVIILLLSTGTLTLSPVVSITAAPKQPPRGPLPKSTNLPRFAPDEVLVAFQPGVRPDVVAQVVGARIDSQIQGLGVYVLKVPKGTVESTLRSLDHNPLVEFAEPNGVVYALADPVDQYDNEGTYPSTYYGSVNQSWYWTKVQAYQAWDLQKGNCGVKAAVVDTGIDVGDPNGLPPDTPHPDLNSCGITIKSFISGETGNDDDGHGTHIAGVIGAKTDNGLAIAGGNWNVHLMGVKVLYYDGSGYWSTVASGIRWAADNGAKVINLSLGGPVGSRTLKKAVDYAWNRGAVLACAAGNEGNTAPGYPAFYPNCIAVAATDQVDARAPWSTYGSWVEVAAPGVGILSTIQDNFYWCYLCWWPELEYAPYLDALSGTSMATSFVSALAALIWASGKCADNVCVRNRIENNTDPVGGFVTKGRINFYKALSAP